MIRREPELSIVLATDSFATIRPVLECLRAQRRKEVIEIVLVTPAADRMSASIAELDGFAAIRIVADPVQDLAPARAAGVRAAKAPGELLGYAGLFASAAEQGMHRYEVHKLRFTGPLQL